MVVQIISIQFCLHEKQSKTVKVSEWASERAIWECMSCFSYEIVNESGIFLVVVVVDAAVQIECTLRWQCWHCSMLAACTMCTYFSFSVSSFVCLVCVRAFFSVFCFVGIYRAHPYFTTSFIWCFVVNYCFLRAIVGEWPGFVVLLLLFLLLDIFHFTIAIWSDAIA